VLLCTERSRALAPRELLEGEALDVPGGSVPELAATLLEEAGERPVVGLGGGRVVDVAKAVAAVNGTAVAAIPTTLAGSPFTPFHRLPEGAQATMRRPSLVICEPAAMVPGDPMLLAATAMNSLAHAVEALYAPFANPVTEQAALYAAALFAEGLPRDPPIPEVLAEAAFLAGYAVGNAGLAVHHAVSQTIVRTCGTPHAQTNAVMLPHSVRLMLGREPEVLAELARALGDPDGDPDAAPGRIAKLAARSGHTRLRSLGVEENQLAEIVAAALQHPGVGATPLPPDEGELLGLLRGAL
jgi:alcohol dehydrogenase class IV